MLLVHMLATMHMPACILSRPGAIVKRALPTVRGGEGEGGMTSEEGRGECLT